MDPLKRSWDKLNASETIAAVQLGFTELRWNLTVEFLAKEGAPSAASTLPPPPQPPSVMRFPAPPIGPSIDLPSYRSINRPSLLSVHQSNFPPLGQSIDLPSSRSINRPSLLSVHQSTFPPLGPSIDLPSYRSINRPLLSLFLALDSVVWS